MRYVSAILFLLALQGLIARASQDTMFLDQAMEQENRAVPPYKAGLSPEEIYHRTQKVFEYFQVPPEADYQPELDTIPYTTKPEDFARILKSLDPTGQFNRFFTRDNYGLRSYADRDSKRVPEYSLRASSSVQAPRLTAMRGLRVALDPGHMGGRDWDVRLGKYVKQGDKWVSEAVIALQTALLIEQRLKAMGAEVMITHRELGPVSTVPYEKLDMKEYSRRELRYRSLEPWFQSLLASASEASLGPTFAAAAPVKKLFSEVMRGDYYSMREDLFARDRKIRAFKPDLLIVLHFDASDSTPSSKYKNRTMTYIAGSYPATDFSQGEIRAHFMEHLAQGEQWKRSVDLSTKVINEISRGLNVPFAESDGFSQSKLAPGVFARNLVLSRHVTYCPTTYLESLFYGNQEEFNRLSNYDAGSMTIGGKPYGYSTRLVNLADAIVRGVVKYADAY